MTTIPPKGVDTPTIHSLRAGNTGLVWLISEAELGGCLIGSCGTDVVDEIIRHVIDVGLIELSQHAQGQILSYVIFYALLSSILWKRDGKQYV